MGTTLDQPLHADAIDATVFAAGVERLRLVFVNAYLVSADGGGWVLVDTGLPGGAELVRRRAAERFGPDARPAAIVLTHGHFDHAGNARALADAWDVPVFAHPLELPYLTGRSDYPPQDPTVGGALGFLSRAFPHGGRNLGARIRPLPPDGNVPGLPGWRWHHTPGHTTGHVSLFRESDRTLLAGDALATVDQDSPLSMFEPRAELSVPPAPMTSDWFAARASVEQLAALRPRAIGAGHGAPVRGDAVADDLVRFAAHFTPPRRGRYVVRPAVADARGVVSVPPPVPDPLPARLLVAGLIAGGLFVGTRRRRPG